MMRGAFGNIRLKNYLVPEVKGGWTIHLPDGEGMSVYDAAIKYMEDKIPLVAIAGKDYGTGSSRDWAAKGTQLLGIKAVIAESFERIHRSNLICMGVLPLMFKPGENRDSLNLDGREIYDITGIENDLFPNKELSVRANNQEGTIIEFKAIARIDTNTELKYYKHGGILPFMLKNLSKGISC
jgi:aconitate hydratase